MTSKKRIGLAVALITMACPGAQVQRAQAGDQTGAQAGQSPESMQPEIARVLSLITGGLLSVGTAAPQVVAHGDAFDVRIPMKGLTTPADAAMQAVLRPAGGGIWQLVSLTIPTAGSVTLPPLQAPSAGKPGDPTPGSLTFSIKEQAIHGRIDPTLTAPSRYAGVLSGIEIHTELGGTRTRQTLDQYSTEGVVTGEADNRMTLRSQATLQNWQMKLENPASGATGVRVRSMALNYAVEGLDRDKAAQMRALLGQFSSPSQPNVGSAATGAVGPGAVGPGAVGPGAVGPSAAGAPSFSALMAGKRAPLIALLGVTPGLLSRISEQAALQDIHLERAGGGGVIGLLRLSMDGAAVGDRVDGAWDLAVSGLKLSAVPVGYVRYVPSRIGLRLAASGVQSAALRQLMADSASAQPDVAALVQEAAALLADPATRVGIDAFSLDAEPLHVKGSGRIRMLPDGATGADIHVAATGVDAMIAQAQGDPAIQQILPIVFLAKGMGRADGDALVWDISFADGVTTVNGIPLGGLAGQRNRGQPATP